MFLFYVTGGWGEATKECIVYALDFFFIRPNNETISIQIKFLRLTAWPSRQCHTMGKVILPPEPNIPGLIPQLHHFPAGWNLASMCLNAQLLLLQTGVIIVPS